MAELQPPVLIKPLPTLALHEGKDFGPIDLRDYIQSPNQESGRVKFYAEIEETAAELPSNIVCMESGLFGGRPERGTKGNYRVIISAENACDNFLVQVVDLVINELPAAEDPLFLANFKEDVWQTLGLDQAEPMLNEAFTSPVSAADVHHLMQRFGTFTIWDVYNLEAPNNKVLLKLPDISKHYNVYDRGACIVGTPKSLFNHERTLADAIQTAKAMAKEVYQRGWTIEFNGNLKMMRAAWIELQVLASRFNKSLEIMHYQPTERDLALYEAQVETARLTP